MPLFKLSATVTVSAYTSVVADTFEEAVDIASDRDAVIGGNGTGNLETESWIIDEADGMPQNIHLTND